MRAASEAILACAAAFGVGTGAGGEAAFLFKKRLPVGRSLVSSFRENFPNFMGATLEADSDMVGASVGVVLGSGGEWNLMKDRPYFSFCKHMKKLQNLVYTV